MSRSETGAFARLKRRMIVGKLSDFRKTGDPSILRDPSVFAAAVRLGRASRDASPQDVAGLVLSGQYFLARYVNLYPADKQDLDVAVEIFAIVARHDPNQVPAEIVDLAAKAKSATRASQTPQPKPALSNTVADAAKAANDRGTRAIRQAEADSDRFGTELAINELSDAVRLAEDDPPVQAAYLNNLSYAWSVKFDLTGHLADLDEAITVTRRSLAILPPDHPSRGVVLNGLGAMLLTRSERGGDSGDLDSSVEALREARDAMDPASHCAPANLSNLGAALLDLFNRDRRRPDLDEAITILRQALELFPGDAPGRSAAETNLANALLERSHHGSTPVPDLDEAISLLRAAFSRLGPTDIARPRVAVNLSNGLRRRYRLAADPADALDAARVLRDAMAVLSPADHWHGVLAAQLSDAAALLSEGHESSGPGVPRASRAPAAPGPRPDGPDSLDAETLRAQVREAIPDRPPSTGDLVSWAYANADAGRAAGSIRELRKAAFSADASVMQQLNAANAWARIASATDPAQALTAYRTALARVPELGGEHLDAKSRVMAFAEFNGLASEAAALAVELGNLEEAVGLLEENRNLWRAVAAGSTGSAEHASGRPDPAALRAAAADGPVVILNPATRRNDALIVTRDDIMAVPFDVPILDLRERVSDFGAWASEVHLDHFDHVLLDTLSWMTEAVTAPVLEQLRISGSERRLWWCPASMLSVLPWHATALDDVVSSYTPSLRSLLAARSARDKHRAPVAEPPRVLSVGVAQALGLDPLPQAAGEANEVATYFRGEPTVLLDAEATRDRVLAQIPQASWLHLACHASQSFYDPLDGFIALSDGQITVADLMMLSVPDGEFAFLAACETSQVNGRTTDETITVATALHEAGYRSVIATGWTIGDAIAQRVTRLVYQDITGARPDASRAALALHRAARRLRADWPQEPSAWAAYMHIGV